MCHRIRDKSLCRQVDDTVKPSFCHERDKTRTAHIHLSDLYTCRDMVPAAADKAVKDRYILTAVLQQFLKHMGADEARSSRHKDLLHASIFLLRICVRISRPK